MTALEFFREAREAARDMESTRRQLEALSRSGRAGVVERQESRLRERIERDRNVIDRASQVLYADGGVATVLSPQHADVLWWRYLNDAPWKAVARNLGISYTTAHQLHRESLSMIDESHLIESIRNV